MSTDKITIKTIQLRTGVPVTGEFIIETLKVEPVEREKRSVFWTETQYGDIVDKLVSHLQANKGNKAIAPKPEAKPKKDEAAAPAPADNFNFGGTAAPAPSPVQAPAPAFNFAAPAPAPAAGFNFGGEAAVSAPAPAAGGFNFG